VTPTLLDPDESPEAHSFADTWLYRSDLALLGYLLQDLRALIRRAVRGENELVAYQTLTWEVHELQRRTVICDPQSLMTDHEVHVVGFFGERRAVADDVAIDDVEVQLLAEFESYPGILSYSSVELVDKQWANLVVHTAPDDREQWRQSAVHVHAVDELAPVVYHNVRIHNGCLPGGVPGIETIVIESTKYWDYDCSPVWHAFRELPQGAHEIVEIPGAELT